MAHAPQFLKLVNEAKKKIKETNVADVKRRMDAGEKFLNREAHSLLWRRISFCISRGKPAKNGLFERGIHGWRLERLGTGRSAYSERLASNLSSFPNEIGWGGRIRELTSAPAKPSKTEANQG